MKVTKQPDGLYTVEADNGKMLINNVGIKCKRAVDQTEKELSNWSEK